MDILVHGFNVKDPQKSTGKLQPYLKQSLMFNYGWRVFSVLWHNKKDAKKLKSILDIHSSSVVYAHSNGCAIAIEAARQGAKIKALICINPALKVDTKFPDSIGRVMVIHTKHDKPTRAARFFDKVPFFQLLVPNAWGAMGAKGSSSDDNRVRNWDLSDKLKGHSDFFKDKNLKNLMPLIDRWFLG